MGGGGPKIDSKRVVVEDEDFEEIRGPKRSSMVMDEDEPLTCFAFSIKYFLYQPKNKTAFD